MLKKDPFDLGLINSYHIATMDNEVATDQFCLIELFLPPSESTDSGTTSWISSVLSSATASSFPPPFYPPSPLLTAQMLTFETSG
jgi:hypothetical protein